MKKIILIICFLASSILSYSQISIVDNQTAATLAQKLVGYGVTIANPVLDCQGISNGVFNVTSSNLGIDSGIILTSGRSMTSGLGTGANGPGTGFASTQTWTTFGNDPDLDIITNPAPTRDRCVLEFDFTTIGDTVKFDYVFASEEYPGFTCTNFFDAFGFFISGPGISGPFSLSSQNIALVPGTNCPVGINTINGSTSNPCGSVVAPCAPPNNALFNTNAGGTSVTYSGFTDVLTAVSAVIPCSTYHIKLAIADGTDHVLDSGVWLKAGSFTSNIINIKLKTGLSSTYPYIIEGCDSAKLTLTRTIVLGTPYADTVHFLIAGNAINGTDYAYLQDTVIFTANLLDTTRTLDLYAFQDGLNEGSELIKLYVLSGCAQVITDSIIIEIRDSLSFNLFNSDTAICEGLTVNISGQVDSGISILWSPPNGVTNINTLLTQISPTNIGSQYYFATGTYASCTPVTKGFTITNDPQPILTHIDDIEICEGQPYNIVAVVTPTFNYITNWLPSTSLTNPTGYTTTFIGDTSQYINFTAVSPNAGCKATQTFHVKVWPFTKGDIKPDTVTNL